MNNVIYKHVEHYVTELYNQHTNPNLVYHNLEHTKEVVKRALEIAAHCQLPEDDMLTVFIAAWFHDTGNLFVEIPEHEQKSVELMTDFMHKETHDETLINNIASCILMTHFNSQPVTQVQQIICDADTYHFGTKDFKRTNKLVKKEFILRHYNTILFEWEKNTLDMLEKHKFHTSYCEVLLEEGKRKNIERIKRKYLKAINNNSHNNLFNEDIDESKSPDSKGSLIPRGIQTMFRLTSSNHLRLSEMADRKAHILISVNSIIISVILTIFIKRAEADSRGIIPALIFLASNLITIILAILATRPKITEGNFLKEDVLNKKTNLLFFGNFYKSSLEEYEWAMSTLMRDQEYLYSVLVQDIHQLGVILGRKYKLIRLAYDVFMIGLVITVAAFLIVVFLYNQQAQEAVISTASGSPL